MTEEHDCKMLVVVRVLGVRPCCEDMAEKVDLDEIVQTFKDEVRHDVDVCPQCGRGFEVVILGPGEPRPRGVANYFKKK